MYELRVPRLQIIRSKFEKQEDLDNNSNVDTGPLGFVVAEGDRRVLFGAFVEMDVETAVYGIELEVADVTFELMRSTVLFPVI